MNVPVGCMLPRTDVNLRRTDREERKRVAFRKVAAAIGALLIEMAAVSPADATPAHLSNSSPPLMALRGTYQVDASGAFTYDVPLKVAPGTAGMEPELSLHYSSTVGDGILGLGWTLRVQAKSANRRRKPETPELPQNTDTAASATSNISSAGGTVNTAFSPGPMADLYGQNNVFDLPAPVTRCPRTVAQDSGVRG